MAESIPFKRMCSWIEHTELCLDCSCVSHLFVSGQMWCPQDGGGREQVLGSQTWWLQCQEPLEKVAVSVLETKGFVKNKVLDNFINKEFLFKSLIALVFHGQWLKTVTPWHIYWKFVVVFALSLVLSFWLCLWLRFGRSKFIFLYLTYLELEVLSGFYGLKLAQIWLVSKVPGKQFGHWVGFILLLS